MFFEKCLKDKLRYKSCSSLILRTDRFLENMKKRIEFIYIVKVRFLISTAEYAVMEHFPDLTFFLMN